MIISAINTNYSALSNLQTSFNNSTSRIASGTIQPSDNPAGVAISERMRSQMSGSQMAQKNITNQISMYQTSQSYSQNISNNLNRMRDLTIQARGLTNESDKSILSDEFKDLQDDISRITSYDNAQGKYNGINLFQGDSLEVQSGPDLNQTTEVELPDLQITSQEQVGNITFGEVIDSVKGMDIMDSDAIESLDAAIELNSKSRATTAANESRAQQSIEALMSSEDNLNSSESKIRDVDIAKEQTNRSSKLIQQNINYALMTQGNNLESEMILKLLA